MKKLVSFLMSIVMLLGVGGCSMKADNFNQNDPENLEQLVVGYSTPNINDRFQRYVEVAAREYAEQNDIEFLLADAQENAITQQQQVKDMIAQGVQGLIVVPVDTRAMNPITQMAKDAGIPLVYLNRNPYGESFPEGVYFVGSKETDAGVMQADFLSQNLKSGNIGILMGPENNQATIARTQGFEDEIKKYPDLKIIAKGTANWNRNEAYPIVKEWLQTYGNDLNAIVSNNDEMALGAIRALKEAGRNDVTVVGIDGLSVGRRAVQDGTLAATVFQDGDVQGETAVKTLVDLIAGQKPENQITWVPFILITQGVINKYPESAVE